MPLRPELLAAAMDRALAAFRAGSIDEFCRLLADYSGGCDAPESFREVLTVLQWHAQRRARRHWVRWPGLDAGSGTQGL